MRAGLRFALDEDDKVNIAFWNGVWSNRKRIYLTNWGAFLKRNAFLISKKAFE